MMQWHKERQPRWAERYVRIGRMAIVGAVLLCAFVGSGRAMSLAGGLDRGVHLLMIDRAGCFYCQQWEEEVGTAYPLTAEGRFAPLVRQHIADRRGEGIAPVVYTPTFVLVRAGAEVGRITGYVSADFFWGLLAPLLQQEGYA